MKKMKTKILKTTRTTQALEVQMRRMEVQTTRKKASTWRTVKTHKTLQKRQKKTKQKTTTKTMNKNFTKQDRKCLKGQPLE